MFQKPAFGFTTINSGAFGEQQQQQTGTADVKYEPVVDKEEVVKEGISQNVHIKFQCITRMEKYENKSIEELRLEDYRNGKSSFAIGLFQQQTGDKPLFGNTSFGQPATTSAPSLFGGGAGCTLQSPSSSFSFDTNAQSTNTTGLSFGTAPTTGGTGLFGATTTQAPAFGTSTSTFGFASTTQPQQPPGSLPFGGVKPASSGFGALPASTDFGPFGSTGVFGAKTEASRFYFGPMTTEPTTKEEERKKLSSSAGGLFGGHQSIFKATRMETKEVTQKGNLLKAKLTVTQNDIFRTFMHTSPEFVINGVALFQVRLDFSRYNHSRFDVLSSYSSKVSVRFTKRRHDDDHTYMIYFNSVKLNIVGKTFTSDDGTWHLIHEDKRLFNTFDFDVSVEMRLQPSASSFAGLHGDTELTDFELRGEDGGVRMHRAVLAAASPVLRRMLAGAWRETAEGHVDVTGTTKATLEHLKNYVYLHELPESGLGQLLLLSSYYIMPELEQLCVDRLVRDVSAENACDLIEFAAKNNVKRLLLAVLECVQNGAISVTEIRDHLDASNDAPNTANSTAEQNEK